MISLKQKLYLALKSAFVVIVLTGCFTIVTPSFSNTAYALHCCPPGRCSCSRCCGHVGRCSSACTCVSSNETGTPSDPSTTMGHITKSFQDHKQWLINVIFLDGTPGNPQGLLAAMQLMTNQLTSIGMQQVQAVGMFFDAKHQLETQRIFQTMVAEAHRDYQPSEALCEVGSLTQSLASSSQIRELSSNAISRRGLDRLILSGDSSGENGIVSDKSSRLVQFIMDFCDPNDNAGNLSLLCQRGNHVALMYNKDINFTQTVSAPLTLDLDFTNTDTEQPSDDEKAYFALVNNLFGHELQRKLSEDDLSTRDGRQLMVSGYEAFMDARALTAKRSVAINSIASIGALKAKGTSEAQPFIYAVLKELGTNLTSADLEEILGDKPSYYAQMEVLTKIANQNTDVITELMDKPANVARKDVALLAVELMQKRDTYRSLLRSEAVIATMLETALIEEQNLIQNVVAPTSNSPKAGGE